MSRAPNEPARPGPNEQECQFWAKFGRFGQKIVIFTGESKSFGTHKPEKPRRHPVRIDFWSSRGRNALKKPKFDPKIHILGHIWPLMG